MSSPIETHYARPELYQQILQALKDQGKTEISRQDLAAVDEFHVRGAAVSMELAKEAGFNKEMRILDAGCGIGGPCRMLASEFGCHITGIDITEEFIQTAKLLTQLVGLDHLVQYIHADALNMPFENESFDIVWTQHVQMNIRDKEKFYSEIKRVLKPGGRLIYYDIFTKSHAEVIYPVPWANDHSISFLVTSATLYEFLIDDGFIKIEIKDHTKEGIQFLKEMTERINSQGQPKLSMHLIMGDLWKEKLQNLLTNLENGVLEIESGIYQKPADESLQA